MSTNQKEVKKKIKATPRNSEVFPKTSHLNFTRHAINSDTNPSLLSQSLFHSSTKTRDGKTKENFDSINLLDSNNEKMNELNSDKYEETKQHLDSNVVANYLRFDTEQASDKTYSIISNASSQSSFESVNNYYTNEIEFTEKAKNFSRFGLSDSDINYHYNSDAYKYDRSLRNQLVTYDLVEELAKCIMNVNSTALNKTVQNSNSSSGSSSDTSSSYFKTDDESWSYYSSSGDLIAKSSSHTPFSSSQNLSSKDDIRENQSWSFSTNDFDDDSFNQSNKSAKQKTCTQLNNSITKYSTSSDESNISKSSTHVSNDERLKKNQTNQQNIDPRQLLEELFNSSERYRKQPYIGDWKEIEKIIEKCSDLKGIHTALSEHSRNNQGKRIHPEFLSFLSTLVNENEKTNHQSNITFFTELPDNSSEIIYSSNSSSSDDSDSDDFLSQANNKNQDINLIFDGDQSRGQTSDSSWSSSCSLFEKSDDGCKFFNKQSKKSEIEYKFFNEQSNEYETISFTNFKSNQSNKKDNFKNKKTNPFQGKYKKYPSIYFKLVPSSNTSKVCDAAIALLSDYANGWGHLGRHYKQPVKGLITAYSSHEKKAKDNYLPHLLNAIFQLVKNDDISSSLKRRLMFLDHFFNTGNYTDVEHNIFQKYINTFLPTTNTHLNLN